MSAASSSRSTSRLSGFRRRHRAEQRVGEGVVPVVAGQAYQIQAVRLNLSSLLLGCTQVASICKAMARMASNEEISAQIYGAALIYIISRNPHLKCLKARGCKGLSQQNRADDFLSSQWCEKLSLVMIIKTSRLSTKLYAASVIYFVFQYFSVLSKILISFKQVSDYAVRKLLETLRKLMTLEFCYCIGDLSPLCFKFSVPSLRKLKLERVTPWMTNQDLTLLTQNFPNLIDLSLIGCRCLDADSQQIVSYGWPGLISLCLEDCGGITSRGACSLFTCKALENLLLRHNGPGIKKNFILDAASKLPMLRNISLDWCDASEGDFDLPLVMQGCLLLPGNFRI